MTSKTRSTALGAAGALSAVSLLTAALAIASPVIHGTGGPDTMTGTDKRDLFRAGPGNDTIDAKGGRDGVRAGRGNDIVEAGLGQDSLFVCLRAEQLIALNRETGLVFREIKT